MTHAKVILPQDVTPDWFTSPAIHTQREFHVIQSLYRPCWPVFTHGNAFTSVTFAWKQLLCPYWARWITSSPEGVRALSKALWKRACESLQLKECSGISPTSQVPRLRNRKISTDFPRGLKNTNAFTEEALFEVSQAELSAEYSHCPTINIRNQVQNVPG